MGPLDPEPDHNLFTNTSKIEPNRIQRFAFTFQTCCLHVASTALNAPSFYGCIFVARSAFSAISPRSPKLFELPLFFKTSGFIWVWQHSARQTNIFLDHIGSSPGPLVSWCPGLLGVK